MNQPKHTPGPWVVGFSADNGIMCVDAPEFDGIEICEVWGEENDKTVTPMSTANARLIAAAPELLEALKDMLSGWRYIQQDPMHREIYGVGWERAQRLAEAAIAKAEGAQP